MACIWNLIQCQTLSNYKHQSQHKKADKVSKIFYDWYSQLLNSFTEQECKFTDWIADCRMFFKQEGYTNIRGMHNDNDTGSDLAANLWWRSFCLLFVFGSQGGLQYKISYSPWRPNAATSCVVHFNCLFNFLKLQEGERFHKS